MSKQPDKWPFKRLFAAVMLMLIIALIVGIIIWLLWRALLILMVLVILVFAAGWCAIVVLDERAEVAPEEGKY